jgi:hypothetical protein
MHTFQFDAMKSTTSTGQWLDIQKAAAAAQGQNNPIFKGNVGEYNGVLMHKHRNVIRRSDAVLAPTCRPPARCSWARRPAWWPTATTARAPATSGPRK